MKLGGKKCLPQNACDWVVTDVYRVLSRTGFLEDPLLTSAASRVLWPPCCLKRGAPKINWLNCSALSPPLSIVHGKFQSGRWQDLDRPPFSQPGLGHEPDRLGLKDNVVNCHLLSLIGSFVIPRQFPKGTMSVCLQWHLQGDPEDVWVNYTKGVQGYRFQGIPELGYCNWYEVK